MEELKIEWQAPEFEYREKDISWYWLSIIVAVLILSVSVWQKNFLFAAFVVMAEMLILVWAGRKPREISFSLDEKGLTISGNKSRTFPQGINPAENISLPSPSLHDKTIEYSGKVRDKFYPYSAIENFSVREGHSEEWYDISLKLRHGFRHHLNIQTPTKNLSKIEEAISRYVERTEPEDSFLDSLERLIGF